MLIMFYISVQCSIDLFPACIIQLFWTTALQTVIILSNSNLSANEVVSTRTDTSFKCAVKYC